MIQDRASLLLTVVNKVGRVLSVNPFSHDNFSAILTHFDYLQSVTLEDHYERESGKHR